MYFSVNEFEVGVNDSVFSGNEQQKVYKSTLSRIPCAKFAIMLPNDLDALGFCLKIRTD